MDKISHKDLAIYDKIVENSHKDRVRKIPIYHKMRLHHTEPPRKVIIYNPDGTRSITYVEGRSTIMKYTYVDQYNPIKFKK